MQRSLANRPFTTQQALAKKLQKTLQQAQTHAITWMVQLAKDTASKQSIDRLLAQPISNANVFFIELIDMFKAYKQTHRSRLGASHPKHKQVWQIIYGEQNEYQSQVKSLLKKPNYGLDTHWAIWETVFNSLNQQLRRQMPQTVVLSSSRNTLFAPASQVQNIQKMSMPATVPQRQQIPALQNTQVIVNDDKQSNPTFVQKIKQLHQSHAVAFKFAKYLLIIAISAAALMSTSFGIALLLDLAFDLGAAAFVAGGITEIIAGFKILMLFAAKELVQLAKKNVQQQLRDDNSQAPAEIEETNAQQQLRIDSLQSPQEDSIDQPISITPALR